LAENVQLNIRIFIKIPEMPI